MRTLFVLLSLACIAINTHAKSPALGFKPNIVWILTDDQDVRFGLSDEYTYHGSLDAMPFVKQALLSQGAFLDNFLVTTPICCPSRTEMMSGRYFHNVGPPSEKGSCMHVNTTHAVDSDGIFGSMKNAGYNVGVFGKVTNDQTNVLPLATKLDTMTYIDSPIDYNVYDGLPYYRLFPNGTHYTDTLDKNHPEFSTTYQTSQIGNRTLRWLDDILSNDADTPFFAYIGPHAPHFPAEPAPWYRHLWAGHKAPRTPNYNASGEGKTQHVLQNPPFIEDANCWLDQHFRDRWSSLKSVDEVVEAVYNRVAQAGLLDKTIFIYNSDHGYKLGQFRLDSKQHPYETDLHVPFVIRGPGIAKGSVRHELSGNPDILPTLMDLAGADIPNGVDGHSMVPFLIEKEALHEDFQPQYTRDADTWRQHLLVEYLSVGTYYLDHAAVWSDGMYTKNCGDGPPRSNHPNKKPDCVEEDTLEGGTCYFVDSTHSNSWRALRIMESNRNWTYVEYDSTWSFNKSSIQHYELYNLANDPYQLQNVYNQTASSMQQQLHQMISDYWGCRGNACP